MAPELLEGAMEFSAFAFQQIDVYAAALVMWEVLSRTRVPEDGNGRCRALLPVVLSNALDAVPDYLLPYEKELALSPSIGHIRELVVIRKFRPEVRESLLKNKVVSAASGGFESAFLFSGVASDRQNDAGNVGQGAGRPDHLGMCTRPNGPTVRVPSVFRDDLAGPQRRPRERQS